MTKVNDAEPSEPRAESLEAMPEINGQRFRRLPGRGHHASRSVGEIVTIDAELTGRGERAPSPIAGAHQRARELAEELRALAFRSRRNPSCAREPRCVLPRTVTVPRDHGRGSRRWHATSCKGTKREGLGAVKRSGETKPAAGASSERWKQGRT